MTYFPECSTITKDKKYTIAAERTTLHLVNKDMLEIEIAKFDECKLTSGKKCDFAVVCEIKNIVHLIEMKGITKVADAIYQLEATLSCEIIKGLITNLRKRCWIVSSVQSKRLPRIMEAIQNDREYFRTNFK